MEESNPYEATSTSTPPTTPRPVWHYVVAILAGVTGYGVRIAVLGLAAWLNRGWPTAIENLERVLRIHRAWSLNTLAAFTPNLALALLVFIATTKSLDSDRSSLRWWILACSTVLGDVVVLFATHQWNLIPWTWTNELYNTARSALTLSFPIVVYLVMWLVERRSTQADGGEAPSL